MRPEYQAALFFLAEENIAQIVPLGEGNINDTFTVTSHSGEQRVLQRLNPSVFPDPLAVMRNMRLVLDHLHRENEKETSEERNFSILSLLPGKTGDWFEAGNGSIWRLMNMIGESATCSTVLHPRQAKELGRGLGFFHRLLSNLDPELLFDTLPDIHNTLKYLHNFDNACSRHELSVTSETAFCTDFIQQRRSLASKLADTSHALHYGVIHGDPKVDNFLFDHTGNKVVSLIDLDTVKPGLLLHDLGDGLRSCCNTRGETTVHFDKILFDPDLFHSWLAGYFAETGSLLGKVDRQHIVDFVRLITFELGLRFYSDYLDGNKYFKVRFPEQNLQRAMVQFYLVQSIEKQWDHLQSLVDDQSRSCTR